jgi:hypothetical protein
VEAPWFLTCIFAFSVPPPPSEKPFFLFIHSNSAYFCLHYELSDLKNYPPVKPPLKVGKLVFFIKVTDKYTYNYRERS